MNREIKILVLKIMNSALEVTYNTKHDVVVGFVANVKLLKVLIYKDGWTERYPNLERIEIDLNREEAKVQLENRWQ